MEYNKGQIIKESGMEVQTSKERKQKRKSKGGGYYNRNIYFIFIYKTKILVCISPTVYCEETLLLGGNKHCGKDIKYRRRKSTHFLSGFSQRTKISKEGT